MARTWTKAPMDFWPVPGRGDTIRLLPGLHIAHEFDAVEDLTIQGQSGAVVRGSVVPRGGEPRCTLRFPDGCHGLTIAGLEITGSYGRGLRITASERVTISGVKSHGHGIEAIQMGDVPGAQVTDCECYGSVAGDSSYTPDKRHGLYISGKSSGAVVKGLYAHSVTGSGLQLNGPGEGAIIKGVHVSEMLLEKCGGGGTRPISLIGVQGSTFERFCITDVPEDIWGTLFAQGDGEEFACYDNEFRTYSVPSGSRPSEEEGSSRNVFAPGAGWSPGAAPPQPAPEPSPAPPDPLADVRSSLDEALKAISAQAEELQRVRNRQVREALAAKRTDAYNAVVRAKQAMPGA